jgi:hypothetical protein
LGPTDDAVDRVAAKASTDLHRLAIGLRMWFFVNFLPPASIRPPFRQRTRRERHFGTQANPVAMASA